MNIVEWADISFDLLPHLPSLPQEVGSYGFPTLKGKWFTVPQEPQGARFRRIFTCSPIDLIHITMDFTRFCQLSLNAALRQWRNRIKSIVLYTYQINRWTCKDATKSRSLGLLGYNVITRLTSESHLAPFSIILTHNTRVSCFVITRRTCVHQLWRHCQRLWTVSQVSYRPIVR